MQDRDTASDHHGSRQGQHSARTQAFLTKVEVSLENQPAFSSSASSRSAEIFDHK